MNYVLAKKLFICCTFSQRCFFIDMLILKYLSTLSVLKCNRCPYLFNVEKGIYTSSCMLKCRVKVDMKLHMCEDYLKRGALLSKTGFRE